MSIDDQTKQHDDRALFIEGPRLSDESAAQLAQWLYELALSVENSYMSQIQQHNRDQKRQYHEIQQQLFTDDF